MVPSIYIPGTTPHCLVSTEGNGNSLGTRNLVYFLLYPGEIGYGLPLLDALYYR